MVGYWTIEVAGEADDTFLAMLDQIRAGEDGYMIEVTVGDKTVPGRYLGVQDNDLVLMESDDEFDGELGERRFPLAAVDKVHVY